MSYNEHIASVSVGEGRRGGRRGKTKTHISSVNIQPLCLSPFVCVCMSVQVSVKKYV